VSRGAGTVAAAVVLLLGTSCGRREGGAARAADPLAGARELVEQRRFDEAIESLGSASDPEALYLLGRAWIGKAETATAPTPVPGSGTPGAALLKAEEAQALGFLERALGARPDHAAAQLALAEVLAPHALARARTRGAGAGGVGAAGATDVSVERVLRAYGAAAEADPAGTAAVEGLIRFAMQAGRRAEADGGYQELVKRRREDPSLLVRYGDFLAGPGEDPEGALAQYGQALIWKADDTKTRVKMAEIHLAAAQALLAKRQYLAAEARVREARRFVVDPASRQATRAAEIEGRLREIRGR
jgi:tetratricopeptide (TPR) repeat protein